MSINRVGKLFLGFGAGLGGLAVVIGAFATHVLRTILDEHAQSLLETAVRYQMYHSLALVAVGLLCFLTKQVELALKISGSTFILGVLCFSGSLYGLSFDGPIWLGPITPIGGIFLLLGWISLVIATLTL